MSIIDERLEEIRIVPVVKIERAEDAKGLAGALVRGGIPCAEVTFRTDAAAQSIRLMSEAYPEMLVGAGTVLKTGQVDAAIEAGAEFIVSPGLNPKIVRYCQEKGIPVYPGVATASEIEQALELGLSVVKFFPAEVNGGVKAIKALSGPYIQLRFMPTGGISPRNLQDYLRQKNVLACGGSWIAPTDKIESGCFAEITGLAREAAAMVAAVRGSRAV